MQPYRVALASKASPSCLDPPIRACEPPPTARVRVGAAVVVAIAMASALGGVCAARAAAHRGNIEIGPAALRHARVHSTRRAPRTTIASRTRPPTATVLERPLVVGVHSPKELAARAKQLASLGLDVGVGEVTLPGDVSAEVFAPSFWPATWVTHGDATRAVDSLELRGLPTSSPLRVANLQDGDQILAVDGCAVGDACFHELDARRVLGRGWVVVEIARGGGHHVLLTIRWRV